MIQYDPHDWSSHLLDIRGSMVREILLRVGLCVGWSVLVVAAQMRWQFIHVSTTFHTLTGVALSLLLVFRTNASYDRFWEGRKLWGSILNESRNIGRLVGASLTAAQDLQREAVRWTSALTYAAMNELRGKKGLGPQAEFLPADQVAQAMAASQSWMAAARKITERLLAARDRGVISDYQFVAIDANVQLLVDYVGGCQRIHGTPLPFAYVVHLRRALILYCYTLPIALVEQFGAWTILWTLLVTYIFAGIEEIGVEIEDPFGEDDNDLPLERFCQVIERDLLAAVEQLAQLDENR